MVGWSVDWHPSTHRSTIKALSGCSLSFYSPSAEFLFAFFFVHNSMPSSPSFFSSFFPSFLLFFFLSFFLSFFLTRFFLSPSKKDRRTRGDKSGTIRAYSSISVQRSIWTEFWSLRVRVEISGCVSGGIWSEGDRFSARTLLCGCVFARGKWARGL